MNLLTQDSPLSVRLTLATGAILLLFGAASGVQRGGVVGEAQPVAGFPDVATKHTVINFSELAAREALSPTVEEEGRVIHTPLSPYPTEAPSEAAASAPEPSVESAAPSLQASPTPSASFQGLDDSNTSIPPDTNGAVGPNHLMVTHNTQVRIQNKTGGILSTVTHTSFWSSLGNPSAFDPRVQYDPFGNRWIIAAVSNAATANSSVLVGVSQTTDPTGVWNLYKIDADAANVNWADYPSLGFNKNWIVVTVNMFANANNAFARSEIYAFNKASLYAAGPGNFTKFSDPQGSSGGFTLCPAQTYDSSLNTLYLLDSWNGNFSGSGYLRLSAINGSVGAETLTVGLAYPSVTTPWHFGGGVDLGPQSGATQKIQMNDDRFGSVVYRNGSLWGAHTVFYPATGFTRVSVQGWQINPTNGSVTQRLSIDDPTGTVFRSFPSIAVNQNNDVLVGFSRFSPTTFASAAYAFRGGADPLNTLQVETIAKNGEAKYFKTFSGTRNRWGDYSSTIVDPSNDTDLWALQEYAATASGGFDRWGTWWAKVTPGASASPVSWRITMSKSTYVVGDDVTVTVFGPKNTGAALPIRVQISMTIPTLGTQALLDAGADGSFTLPANLDANLGPFTLFVVPAGTFPPKGAWTFSSRVTNPSTGAVIDSVNAPFTVQ